MTDSLTKHWLESLGEYGTSFFWTLEVAFLSSRFGSPLREIVNHAELTEIDVETFARTRGSRSPSDEVSGMTF